MTADKKQSKPDADSKSAIDMTPDEFRDAVRNLARLDRRRALDTANKRFLASLESKYAGPH